MFGPADYAQTTREKLYGIVLHIYEQCNKEK